MSEVSEQPQSATAVSAEDVEQEKRCIESARVRGKILAKKEENNT